MPPDPVQNPPPPPTGKPRRRPAPAAGGNWVWMVILLLLAGMFLVHSMGSAGTIEWSEFYYLLDQKNLSKIYVGTDRISGEVKEVTKIPEELQKKLRSGKFTVQRLPINDDSELSKKINALGLAPDKYHVDRLEDHFTW